MRKPDKQVSLDVRLSLTSNSHPLSPAPPQVTPAAVTSSSAPAGQPPIRPIQSGHIVDWEALESLLAYCLYDQLGWIEGAEGPALVVEPALSSRDDRERLAQLMFEVFNVSGYFATDSAVASLYSVGKLSGMVVDVGYEKIGESLCWATGGGSFVCAAAAT